MLNPSWRQNPTAPILLLALLAAACDALGPSVMTVVVTAPDSTVEVTQSIQLSAQARDRSGAPLPNRSIQWTSDPAAVATVSASGLVTGIAAGTATITATIDGTRGSVTISVVPVPVAPVAVVTVSPATATIVVPASRQLRATLTSARGDTLTGRQIAWSSSNAGIASVNDSGVVTAWNAGSATITAESERKSGTATITITVPVVSVTVIPDQATLAVGTTQAFRTVLTGPRGEILGSRPVAWSSSNAAIATVTPTGLVSGWNAGSASITATSENISGSASVTVVACGAAATARVLTAPPAAPGASPTRPTFVRLHDDVARGAMPPRATRAAVDAPWAGAAAGCGQLELRAWEGQPGPEGGTLIPEAWSNPATFAGEGRVAFIANLNGLERNQGVFVAEGASLRAVAIGCGSFGGGGQPGSCGDPTPAGGTFAGFFDGTWFAPATNDAGDVLFLADVYGGSTPRGLFLYRAATGSLAKVAGVGDASPAGGTLTAVGPGSLDGNGNVVFLAFGATPEDHQILYWSNGVLTKIARTGDPAPSGGTWTSLVLEVFGFIDGTSIPVGFVPDIDDAGRVAFRADAGAWRGIVVWQAGNASVYVQDGDPAPGGGTYGNLWGPVLGANGEVTFLGDVLMPTCCLSAWYAGKPGDWRKVLGHYDLVDGYPVLGIAVSRSPMQPITPAGDVLVWVAVQLPDSSYREQFVLVHRDGTYQSIAFQGQPGVPSGILDNLNPWPSIDAVGRATVSSGTPGGAGTDAHFVRVP